MAQPEHMCPYWSLVRDPRGKDVPCGTRVRWQDGPGRYPLYCEKCQEDFAAKYVAYEEGRL